MRISIKSIDVGDETATEAEVSVAVSSSVAVRLVPVVGDKQFPDFAFGIVGTSDQSDVMEFLGAVSTALSALAASRGF